MSRNPIRVDKTCLNCYHVVEKRYCPNCGQENVEPRKTFYELFVHFIEDLTHYENSFWKTIRNLLFKPASLTKEYLSGKRMSYLAPFRLYIFISFVTFFLIAVLPGTDESNFVKVNETTEEVDSRNQSQLDSIRTSRNTFEIMGLHSVAQLDSLQRHAPADEKLPPPIYFVVKKMLIVAEKNTTDELLTEFRYSFISNFPKVLFIYMPLFALVLWLFQNKKRFYYFDHGIFTLHYFSFLLLIYLVLSLFDTFFYMIKTIPGVDILNRLIRFVLTLYMFYYFFPAHHRFYGETRFISALKGSVMFLINMFFITLILLLFAIYTFINIH